MRAYVLVLMAMLVVCTSWVCLGEGGTFFNEDFSGYEVGDPLEDWGPNVIMEPLNKLNAMTSQVKGSHVVEKKVKFPPNFTFEFDFSVAQNNDKFPLILLDSLGESIKIELHDGRHGLSAKLPDTVEKYLKCKEGFDRVKILRKGKTFKVYLNDEFMLSGTYPEFGAIAGFKLTVPMGYYFTRFVGTELLLDK